MASRGWVFTLNNYTDDDERLLRDVDCRYILFGRETAPTTGTPHLQGYVYWKSPKSRAATCTALGGRVWCDKAKGSVEDQACYCKKDGSWFEKGSPPKQGKRGDLASVADALRTGEVGIREVAETNPQLYCQYRNGLESIRRMGIQHRTGRPLINVWNVPEDFAGLDKNNTFFYYGDWDGYQQQKIVVFVEDESAQAKKWAKFVRMGLPLSVPVKYGSEVFNSPIVYMPAVLTV